MKSWLIENEFTGYNHCAYPKGEFTGANDILSSISSYFTSCRTIHQKHRETFPPIDPLKMRVFYITNATTLVDAQAAVTAAVANKEWIVFSFHKIVSTPVLSTEWGTDDFSDLLDFIQSSGIVVKNIGEIL